VHQRIDQINVIAFRVKMLIFHRESIHTKVDSIPIDLYHVKWYWWTSRTKVNFF